MSESLQDEVVMRKLGVILNNYKTYHTTYNRKRKQLDVDISPSLKN